METGHEIISMAILPLPLIQEGQSSVTGEVRLTDRLDMTVVVDGVVKSQIRH